ncbi:uncharacterized protein LACBIDRAFT_327872 [Laccaria bicolor S238N-H82]|uniref:Predicted protein n=1 Tax=Laccaria bicolor (strain S238N-H82 / ATCC MYA-4686) TaxID=486041 RepID=B0DD22_LACBS|nr:uncharacterized protein LACBIDRAFT_327872 [Laccaria bicolor S238N-H82]EDR07537.1 predicted protein [Laccaria bicolor S238N-H82]|eukprot:XP_001881929.1 predicted protein [Laccaria bicolor S238N-H82]
MVKSLLTAITTTVAMDGSVNDEIQGIEEDIRQIAVDNPHLAKWFTATPELMQKKRKQKEKKDKKKASKAASKTTNSTPLPSSSHVEEPADDSSTHSSDDDDDKQSTKKENECPAKKTKTLTNITAYIKINRPPRTLKDKPEPLSRGPFFFTLSTPRIEFLQSLTSCSVEGSYAPTITSINQEQLFWKQQVPANDKKKLLTNEVGYKAMIAKLEELTKKGKDTTITLSLPPLSKVAAMQVVSVPPTAVPQPALNQQFQPYGGYPHPHYFPPPYPYPMLPLYNPHPANNVYPNQYPDAPHPAPAPFLNVPLNPTHAPKLNHAYAQGVRPRTPGILHDAAPGSAPGSPLKVILPRPISLEEFCIHYAVDNEDQARLAKLKVQPGDRRVEKLDREDWQGHAGFAKLAWEDFLAKHKTFISDVKSRKWDSITDQFFDTRSHVMYPACLNQLCAISAVMHPQASIKAISG